MPITQDAVRVVDGDTIDAYGKRVRLVGYDTPEPQALCEAERALAAKATARLQQLVDGGGLDLSIVRCSCKPGTEGTDACNRKRSCGTLTANGRDVGVTLIGEGLAHHYQCSWDRCPRRQPWC